MRGRAALFLTCLLVLASSALVAGATDPVSASIEGTVLGPDTKPVASARVFLQPSDGRVPHVTKTDAHGHYVFSKLRQGFYDLRAQSAGRVSDWRRNVNVHAGATVSITLTLKATTASSTARLGLPFAGLRPSGCLKNPFPG